MLTRIGVHEISSSKRHYLTIVVDQSGGNVIWVGDGKDSDVLGEFYALLGPDRCARWSRCRWTWAAPTRRPPETYAATICWDPFHVVKLLNKAFLDTIRWSRLTRHGLPMTKHEANDLRWAMLNKPCELTSEQSDVLDRHRKALHACWRAQ